MINTWDFSFSRPCQHFSNWMHRLVEFSREDYYIAFLAVYQQVQTRGVGTALMKRAEEDAVSCGAKFICLDVETENENAVRFYQKRGYRIEERFQ